MTRLFVFKNNFLKLEGSLSRKAREFFLNASGNRLSTQGMANVIAEFRRDAGIDRRITPHMLRHTVATLLPSVSIMMRHRQSNSLVYEGGKERSHVNVVEFNESFESYLKENAVAEAMEVSMLDLKTLEKTGKAPQIAMAEFRDWVQATADGRKPVFVGFNASFDWSFVNWYFHKFLGENPFGFGAIDIKAFYMGYSAVCGDRQHQVNFQRSFNRSNLLLITRWMMHGRKERFLPNC